MSAASEEVPALPWGAFLAAEQRSEMRHEWVHGRAYAKAGGSQRHATLTGLLYLRLAPGALSAGCRPFSSDRLVRIGRAAYYPDFVVVCGPAEHDYHESDLSLVVEVLSPTTEDVDRREKALVYSSAPSFEQYLIVDQHRRRIEVGERGSDGLTWRAYGPGHIVVTAYGDLIVGELYAQLDATVAGGPTSG